MFQNGQYCQQQKDVKTTPLIAKIFGKTNVNLSHIEAVKYEQDTRKHKSLILIRNYSDMKNRILKPLINYNDVH